MSKIESTDLKNLNNFKAFVEYLNNIDNIYKSSEEYDPDKKQNILIIFDDMTADMHNNKKFNKIVTDLFISGRKPNVYLVFITQSYFKVLKDGRLNTTHFFSKKFQIAYNHSPDINYNYFMNLYKNCIATPCSFLLVLLLYQSTLYVLERILKKKYKNLS